ncbi:MAG: response regulator transcription factor [Chloroflexi bacterium]|jgi:DNA-binding NarL/FixJ family response regulator|nr:response regulator transcription factor [Chloroflexota bacterium]
MIRVLVVSEDNRGCQALIKNLELQQDICIAGCAADYGEARHWLDEVDAVLASAELPDDGAYILLRRQLLDEYCLPVVVYNLPDNTAAILRYIEGGARGYVLEGAAPSQFAHSLRAAVKGEAYVSPQVAGAVFARLAELSGWVDELRPGMPELAKLTRREREILDLIGHDFTNQDIAEHLYIEVGTVKNHVHNILSKLKVTSRREAARAYFPRMRARSRLAGRRGKDPSRSGFLLK